MWPSVEATGTNTVVVTMDRRQAARLWAILAGLDEDEDWPDFQEKLANVGHL